MLRLNVFPPSKDSDSPFWHGQRHELSGKLRSHTKYCISLLMTANYFHFTIKKHNKPTPKHHFAIWPAACELLPERIAVNSL